LASLELLSDCTPDQIDALDRRLDVRELEAGAVLMRQGDRGTDFALLIDGELVVEREHEGEEADAGVPTVERVADAGPGSILGELALLLHRRRNATVRAAGAATVAVGDTDDLDALLALPGVHDRLENLASRRLAESLRPVTIELRSGQPILLRPLLPADRAAYASAIGALSADSLRRRFLTGGRPSSRMIDYLVDIDYVDHFAWVVQDPERRDAVLGTARFVRLAEDHARAEVAFEVADDHQGRGIATLLLGAIGVAAASAGVDVLVATVLLDNAPMRAVFDKVGAAASFGDPGEIHLEMTPADAAALLDAGLRHELDLAVRDIVRAAGLALARPAAGG
jgi:CRP-like cAMP-binding protein/GNAT superfamily N-acetyltransferase